MPRPKVHVSNAARQRAYRKAKAESRAEASLPSSEGLRGSVEIERQCSRLRCLLTDFPQLGVKFEEWMKNRNTRSG